MQPIKGKTFAIGVILTAGLILAGCGFSERDLQVTFFPENPSQGDTLKIIVKNASPRKRYVCEFANQKAPLFPTQNGDLRALAGLNAEFKPGTYLIEIKRDGNNEKPLCQVKVIIRQKSFRKENITLPPKKTMLAQDPKQMEAKGRISKILSDLSPKQLWDGTFEWPTAGELTSPYGTKRTVNKKVSWPYHKGIDIRAPHHEKVIAANSGIVVLAESFPVQGKMIILDHGQGVMTTYLHLSSIQVKTGDRVEKNQDIARVGSEGFSTGPHLHYGHYVRGEPVDPQMWMRQEF